MKTLNSIADHQAFGDDVLARLMPPPPRLKPLVVRFRAVHDRYKRAAKAAEVARATREEALAKVGAADGVQDAAVDQLAVDLVGASLGKRTNPFSTFTKYTPSDLKKLAYKLEAEEITALVAAVSKASPPAKVKATLGKCAKAATGVLTAITNTTKPQLAYDKARTARDAILPEWTLELHRLQREAAAFFGDDLAAYRATFAPPERLAAPKKKRAKTKKKAPPPTGA